MPGPPMRRLSSDKQRFIGVVAIVEGDVEGDPVVAQLGDERAALGRHLGGVDSEAVRVPLA